MHDDDDDWDGDGQDDNDGTEDDDGHCDRVEQVLMPLYLKTSSIGTQDNVEDGLDDKGDDKLNDDGGGRVGNGDIGDNHQVRHEVKPAKEKANHKISRADWFPIHGWSTFKVVPKQFKQSPRV